MSYGMTLPHRCSSQAQQTFAPHSRSYPDRRIGSNRTFGGRWRDFRLHAVPDRGDESRQGASISDLRGAIADLEVHAHMKIRPGRLEGFKQQAAELIRLTKEKDTRTLRYDWFISRDGTECEVHEAYVSSEGLIEHNANVSAARARRTLRRVRRGSFHDILRGGVTRAFRHGGGDAEGTARQDHMVLLLSRP